MAVKQQSHYVTVVYTVLFLEVYYAVFLDGSVSWCKASWSFFILNLIVRPNMHLDCYLSITSVPALLLGSLPLLSFWNKQWMPTTVHLARLYGVVSASMQGLLCWNPRFLSGRILTEIVPEFILIAVQYSMQTV